MKLTIIRLTRLSEQDAIDLGKIWPSGLQPLSHLDENHRIYAARFNARLLGAVRVILDGNRARLVAFNVREVTRRRGVGSYLMHEVLADNPLIDRWEMSGAGIENRDIMNAFMASIEFKALPEDWVRQR